MERVERHVARLDAALSAAAPAGGEVKRLRDITRALAETDFEDMGEKDVRHVLACWQSCARAALNEGGSDA